MKFLFYSLALSLLMASVLAEENRFQKRFIQNQQEGLTNETSEQNGGDGNIQNNDDVNISDSNNTLSNSGQRHSQTIEVIGKARGNVKSREVVIGYAIESTHNDIYAVYYNNTIVFNRSIEHLKSIGLNDSEFSEPFVQILPQTGQFFDFKVKHSMVLRTNKTDLFGKILDTFQSGGIRQIYVNFQHSENDLENLRVQLIGEAIVSAEKLARNSTEQFGYELGAMKRMKIIDNNFNEQNYQYINDSLKDYEKLNLFEQQVQVIYEIKQKTDTKEQNNNQTDSLNIDDNC